MMQSIILKTLNLKSKVMLNLNSNFFWSSNVLLVGGWLVGGRCIWSVVFVRRSGLGGRLVGGWLVGGFKETSYS